MKIAYGEADLAQQVKSLGGRWNKQIRAWEIAMKYVKILAIEHRLLG